MKAELQEAIEQLSEALLELKKERLLALVEEAGCSTDQALGGSLQAEAQGGRPHHHVPEATPGHVPATEEAATASAGDVESWQRPGSIVRYATIPCMVHHDPLYGTPRPLYGTPRSLVRCAGIHCTVC